MTGAARRIGRLIVEDLAAHGFAVAIHANASLAAAEALAAGLGARAVALDGNLEDVTILASLIARAADRLGPVRLLVNNASLFEKDDVQTLTPDLYERHMAIHVRAPLFLSQAFAMALPPEEGGLIVNVIDQRVWKPTPMFLSYGLSKSALWEQTRILARALAPSVRVNAIGPGPSLRGQRQTEEDFMRQQGSVLLRRGPSPAEFGRTVRYFWENASVTGQMLALDGGQHLAWETPDVVGISE